MRISYSVFLAALISAPVCGQTKDHTPVITIDEMTFAISVGSRLSVVEKCGLDVQAYAVYKRWRQFIASHRESLGANTVERSVHEGIALHGSGIPAAKLPNFCRSLRRAEAAAALPKILDKVDERLRKEHYAVGHIPHWDSDFKEMERRFGPREAFSAETEATISAKEQQRRLEEFRNSPEQVEKRSAENLVRLRDAIGSLPIPGFGAARTILSKFDGVFYDEAVKKAEEELVAEREIDSICDAVAAVGVPTAKGLVVGELLPIIAGKKKPSIKALTSSAKINSMEARFVAANGKSSDRCK